MMAKRGFQLAALWLLLAALVFVYTDRDEYTWRYGQDELPLLLESRAQAAAMQRAADAAFAAEAQRVRERQAAFEWNAGVQYDGAMETLPARDDTPGLNLMWGTYEVSVAYTSPEPLTLSVVSAGRQAFIEDAEIALSAAPQGGRETFAFTLTDSTQRVMLACDLPEGAQVDSIVVHRRGAGVFSRDLAAFALLIGGVLTGLLVLSWDTRPVGQKRRRDAFVLLCAVLFAGMPALMGRIFDGHDLFFHMNRIEGIASALRCGQFPVRIHASTLLGYGYAAPQFYPELFLYIPALLRNLGVSLTASVQVFMLLIHLASALICYRSARRIFANRNMALLSAVLYTLSNYRLINVYARAAFGEALAMVFFPLMIEAMVEILTRDERKWPLLALSMTCVFMSHLLSTLFAAAFCSLAALCCLPRLVREPVRILACVKAAALTVLCSLFFVVPFLQYSSTEINTNIALNSDLYKLTLGEVMTAFSGATGDAHKAGAALANTIGTHPGLSILLGCALLAAARYAKGRALYAGEQGAMRRLAVCLGLFGLVALAGATGIVPWKWLGGLPRPISTIARQIQFPWRLVGAATPFLCMAAACGYLGHEKHRAAGAVLALGLCVVFAGYTLGDFAQQNPILGRDDYADTRIRQYEYLYTGTEKGILIPGQVVYGDEEAPVEAYDKQGTSLTLTLKEGAWGNYLEAPLLYYPGYRAQINGQEATVGAGDNGVIRVYGAFTGGADTVRIWFSEPLAWRVAEGLSLAGFALLAWLLVRRKRA